MFSISLGAAGNTQEKRRTKVMQNGGGGGGVGGGGGQIRCIMEDVQVTHDATLENRSQSILTENRYLLKD